MKLSDYVWVEGVRYNLTDYPSALVESLMDECDDIQSEVVYTLEGSGYTPANCPERTIDLRWQTVVNGTPLRHFRIGEVCGSISVWSDATAKFAGEDSAEARFHWCRDNCQGDWIVTTQECSCCDNHIVYVCFKSAEDEARYRLAWEVQA